jgi:cell division septation protein DedD
MNEITSKVPFFVSSFNNIYDIETPAVAWSAPNAVPQDNVTRAYFMEAKEKFTLTPDQLREVILTLKSLSRQYFNRENAIAILTEDGAQYPTLEVGTSEAAPEMAPEAASETAPEAAPETAPETASETAPEAAPEAAPETAPEAAPEAAPETTEDTGVATEGFYQGLLYR